MHIVGWKLGEAYLPVERESPLIVMPNVQMHSMRALIAKCCDYCRDEPSPDSLSLQSREKIDVQV